MMAGLVGILERSPSNVVALRSLLKMCKKSTNKLVFNINCANDRAQNRSNACQEVSSAVGAGDRLPFDRHGSHYKLFNALASNLAKNSREIRLLTLNLLRRFQPLNFLGAKDGIEQYSEKNPCNCIEIMYEFEKADIGFHTEKSKQAQLERLEVMAKYAVVPTEYHEALYYFLIGSLWIKFTPLFPAVHKCVAALINNTTTEMKEKLVQKHSQVLQGAIWLAQLTPKQEKKLLCDELLTYIGEPVELPGAEQ